MNSLSFYIFLSVQGRVRFFLPWLKLSFYSFFVFSVPFLFTAFSDFRNSDVVLMRFIISEFFFNHFCDWFFIYYLCNKWEVGQTSTTSGFSSIISVIGVFIHYLCNGQDVSQSSLWLMPREISVILRAVVYIISAIWLLRCLTVVWLD